jgi:hypothetical protein
MPHLEGGSRVRGQILPRSPVVAAPAPFPDGAHQAFELATVVRLASGVVHLSATPNG